MLHSGAGWEVDDISEAFRWSGVCLTTAHRSLFMNLRSVSVIITNSRQEQGYRRIWWSRGERLENLRSELLLGVIEAHWTIHRLIDSLT